MKSLSILLLISGCTALYIPRKNSTTHIITTPPSHNNKSNNPQWLFFVSTETIIEQQNSSTPLVEWEFISHLIITPDQCEMISDVVQMLDDALQKANPDVQNVTSAALRVGNQECVDGECPCKKESQETHRRVLIPHRLLEVKTRSSSPDLQPPLLRLPMRVNK
jgi:hypothetical protein